MPRSGHQGDGGGISALTLAIASVASVASAYTVSRLWGPGTLIGAAATPIIVALVSEALRRPAERVPPIVTARAQRHGSAGQAPPPRPAPGTVGAGELAPRKDFSLRRRRRWGLALITGLAAFVIVACVVTIADVVTGEPVTGRDGGSSLFDFRNRTHGDRTRTAPTTNATTPSTSTPATSTTTTTTPTTTAPAPATSAPPTTTSAPQTLPGAPAAPDSTRTTTP